MGFVGKVWGTVIDILFPPICISCHRYLVFEDKINLLCEKCFESIEICEEKPEDKILSIGYYGSKPLRKLIHVLKFKGHLRAMGQIEKLIDKYLEKNTHTSLKKSNVITFIPLYLTKQRKRGFNQAELIAKLLGHKLNVPVTKTLEKVRDTVEQSSLKNNVARSENIRGAFVLTNQHLNDQNIVIVDDVYTSGATTLEAIEVLRTTSPRNMIIFTLSRR